MKRERGLFELQTGEIKLSLSYQLRFEDKIKGLPEKGQHTYIVECRFFAQIFAVEPIQ
jgi:hypothetical protein